jgi:hypothetical protein
MGGVEAVVLMQTEVVHDIGEKAVSVVLDRLVMVVPVAVLTMRLLRKTIVVVVTDLTV